MKIKIFLYLLFSYININLIFINLTFCSEKSFVNLDSQATIDFGIPEYTKKSINTNLKIEKLKLLISHEYDLLLFYLSKLNLEKVEIHFQAIKSYLILLKALTGGISMQNFLIY